MLQHRSTASFSCSLALFVATIASPAAAGETFVFHHEHVLGTSLEIVVEAESAGAASQAETSLLAEIDRLSAIFSTYDPRSELSRWLQSSGEPVPLSPELRSMLAAAEAWQKRSGGAFNPAAAELSRHWRAAQERQTLPDSDALSRVAKSIQGPHWRLDEQAGTAQRLSFQALTFDAIAKGAIVEWASGAALAAANADSASVHGLVVNLGGDLRVCGDAVREVEIADPHSAAENAPPIARVFVANRAVATSGGYRRGFEIGGRRYSHILDPRTGQLASHVASATVVAPSSADADALATIANVLPVAESLALVAATPGAECLIVDRDGRQHTSSGWSELTAPHLYRFAGAAGLLAVAQEGTAKPEAPLKAAAAGDAAAREPTELLELAVDFQLAKGSGGRYRRPYVAVWLEDADEFPVKTAVLWMQTKQPGPRWHRDLLRWYRNDRVRKLADGTDLIDVVSGATRGSGEYQAIFDGRDDAGRPLKPGKYTLFIEAAREHGTYQLIRHPLTLAAEPIPPKELKGNVEVESATVEYRTAPPAAAEK